MSSKSITRKDVTRQETTLPKVTTESTTLQQTTSLGTTLQQTTPEILAKATSSASESNIKTRIEKIILKVTYRVRKEFHENL